jgi:hypothetical protein
MDMTSLVRIAAGIGFVIVLLFLIQRRRKSVR